MKSLFLITVTTMAFATASTWAQEAPPIGLWKTFDDGTNTAKSLVRITETNGELRGKIEKLFRGPDEEQNPKCEKCEGERKNQPIVGMTILSGVKNTGEGYDGGQILDPANGKTYNMKMKVTDGGKRLEVRGYIGVSLFGRTQTWVRVE